MEPFTTLTSVATPFPRDNVDTDLIIPAAWLKSVSREGMGQGAFETLRYKDGALDPDAVFNRPPYDRAQILVAGANFGCGSSREHAAWALMDLGYRCILAESFADIFASNAFKNGILTVALDEDEIAAVLEDADAGRKLTVDLAAQTVTRPAGETFAFAIDPFRKHCLLNGLDEVALTLAEHGDAIAAFEAAQRAAMPWLYG